MMKRTLLTAAAASLLALGVAGPAAAGHDHHLENPSGCHTIPVGHQVHDGSTDSGKKFHGAAHKGATVVHGVLGNGNSRVFVDGGACDQ